MNTSTLSEKSQKFESIIDYYLGSPNELSDEDLNWIKENNLFEKLDEIMFQCDVCGWWCSEDERMPIGALDYCMDCDDD